VVLRRQSAPVLPAGGRSGCRTLRTSILRWRAGGSCEGRGSPPRPVECRARMERWVREPTCLGPLVREERACGTAPSAKDGSPPPVVHAVVMLWTLLVFMRRCGGRCWRAAGRIRTPAWCRRRNSAGSPGQSGAVRFGSSVGHGVCCQSCQCVLRMSRTEIIRAACGGRERVDLEFIRALCTSCCSTVRSCTVSIA
jgi:hypothetical protein